MDKREYRVVCLKEKFSDNVYVDIVPAEGTIHDDIVFTRRKLHQRFSDKPLVDYGTKAIYMTVIDDQESEIDFSHGCAAPADSPEGKAYQELCHKILPQILTTYQQMRQYGKESTLDYIVTPSERVRYFTQRVQRNDKTVPQNNKPKTPTKSPQSLAEEDMMRLNQKIAESKNRRLAQMHKRAAVDKAIDPIERMRRRMQQYSGD